MRVNRVMTRIRSNVLAATAVQAVATQLREAMEKGRRQDRKLKREVQSEVDQLVQFGPRYLTLPSALVILAGLAVAGTGGFLIAAESRSWVVGALIVFLMIMGIFLLDQVRLMQYREDALKTGMYIAAKNDPVLEEREPSQDGTKS